MLYFQRIELDEVEMPKRDDPLYVGHFFKLPNMWWRKRKLRQELIFSIAITWYRLVHRQISAPGMLEEELLMTRLTKQVRDARVIIEHFFTITRLGFNLGDDAHRSPTIVSPKKLPKSYLDSIERHLHKIEYSPGLPPTDKQFVQSVVNVRHNQAIAIKSRLKSEDREDLLPMVNWILKQTDTITFYHRPAGNLKARDTTIWPIKSFASWPGWLRVGLFGTVVDLENSFCQFLLDHLGKSHADNPKLLRLKYPDIVDAVYDKKNFREAICRDVLHLPPHDENIAVVKKLLMALANGSNATAGLMTSDSRSQAAQLVKNCSPDLLPTELIRAGDRLSRITNQFRSAKRELCIYLFKAKPTRENVKRIFQEYFHWEKIARYKIWAMTQFSGISAHDGLDGINISNPETFADEVFKAHNLRVKVTLETA